MSYFLPAVLDIAGYTESVDQANINLGYSCFQLAFALTGAAFVDRFGRRPLMLFSMTGCCIVWIGMTVATSQFDATQAPAAARATVACIFLFGAVFSVGITPLQALYVRPMGSMHERGMPRKSKLPPTALRTPRATARALERRRRL